MATDVANNFHLYAMEWTADEIKFSVDSVVFYVYNPQQKISLIGHTIKINISY